MCCIYTEKKIGLIWMKWSNFYAALFQVTEPDSIDVLHVAMIKVWGSLFMGVCATTYLTRNSLDGFVQLSHFLTRLIVSIFLLS